MGAEVWEQGSDFHLVSEFRLPESQATSPAPWQQNGQFFYSGRQALVALLAFLRERQNVRRVWFPGYFCDQVVFPIQNAQFDCLFYDFTPKTDRTSDVLPQVQPGDAFVVNVLFGLSTLAPETRAALRQQGAWLIEDHSQDPWSELAWISQADYVFASLRKTLPLPDGGVLWSPQQWELPLQEGVPPQVSALRLAAMFAKRAYLRGEFEDKPLFREWYVAAEEELNNFPQAPMSLQSRAILERFDVPRWRAARAKNYQVLVEHLEPRLLFDNWGMSASVPMGAVLVLKDQQSRDALRAFLIQHQVFPAVLWPLVSELPADIAASSASFADCMLLLHCDGRYNNTDMVRVADVVNSWHASRVE